MTQFFQVNGRWVGIEEMRRINAEKESIAETKEDVTPVEETPERVEQEKPKRGRPKKEDVTPVETKE